MCRRHASGAVVNTMWARLDDGSRMVRRIGRRSQESKEKNWNGAKMSGKTAIKSMTLAVLILVSLLQIERLWFENHGLFSSAVQKQTAEQALQDLIMEPEYIALHKGEIKGEYHVLDSAGILFSSILKDTGRVIRQLEKMSVINQYDYPVLFEQPHILYHFSVPISAETIGRIAQIKMPKEAAEITGMALVPAGLAENRFLLLFFDKDATLVKGFSVLKNDLSDENEVFSRYISGQVSAGNLRLSAKQQGLADFAGEVLLPAPKQNYILPQEWKWEAPYLLEADGRLMIDTDRLSEYIFFFVKNPRILWSILEAERARYGDSSTLVEYNTKGIFTYRLAQAVEKKSEALPAGEALKKAVNFMNKDSLLSTQEIKLSAYQAEDGRHHFYFDYYFRGHRLIWNEEMTEHYGVKYPLEVAVEGEQVTLYKRLLLQPEVLLQQGVRFQANYEEVLNRFYQTHDQAVIRDLSLAYFAEKSGVRLGWVIDTDGGEFLYSLIPQGGKR